MSNSGIIFMTLVFSSSTLVQIPLTDDFLHLDSFLQLWPQIHLPSSYSRWSWTWKSNFPPTKNFAPKTQTHPDKKTIMLLLWTRHRVLIEEKTLQLFVRQDNSSILRTRQRSGWRKRQSRGRRRRHFWTQKFQRVCGPRWSEEKTTCPPFQSHSAKNAL